VGDNATNILKEFPEKSIFVYGRGAQSNGTMKAVANPVQSDIYFRVVQPTDLQNLTFHCIHALPRSNWGGDSGTWCWTEDGLLVCMGMATAHIGGNKCCCILPMSDVLITITHLINQPI